MARTSSLGVGSGIITPGLGGFTAGTGKYIGPALLGIANGSGANSADFVCYVPFSVRVATTVNAVVWRNTGTGDSGDKVRVGLYDSTNGLPSTLLQAASEQTLNGAAVTYESAITSTLLIPGKLYYGASTLNASITMDRVTGSIGTSINADFPVVAWPAANDVVGTYYESRSYAALPSTATPTAVCNSGVQFAALLMLKVA